MAVCVLLRTNGVRTRLRPRVARAGTVLYKVVDLLHLAQRIAAGTFAECLLASFRLHTNMHIILSILSESQFTDKH